MPAGEEQPACPRCPHGCRHERPRTPLMAQIGGRTHMVDDPVASAEGAGSQGGSAGQAGYVGRVHLGEKNPVGGQRVDVGSSASVISGTAEMVGAQGVDVDVQNSHGSPNGAGRLRSGAAKKGSSHRCSNGSLVLLDAPGVVASAASLC